MKRCHHRWGKSCHLQASTKRYIFVHEDNRQHIALDRWLTLPFECTPAMAAICDLRDPLPFPKEPPKNPRTSWLKCPYCTTMHRTPETAATCKFYHEEYKLLNGTTMHPWLPEGSRDPWPPYKTSIGDDLIWTNMVDKIIARDGNCCTDCGISAGEIQVILKGVRHPQPDVWVMVDDRWSDREAAHAMWAARTKWHDEAWKQLPSFEVHHIIPRCKGGTHHPHNLRMLCSTCHRTYTNELMGDLAQQRKQEKAVAIALNSFIDSRPEQTAQRSLDVF